MRKKFFITLILVLVFLTACGSNNGGDNNNQNGSPSSTPPPANDKNEIIELTYWDGTWAEEIIPDLIAQFEADNPNIKINVEYFPWDGMHDKYLISLSQDSGPDIINLAVDWSIPFAKMGKLQALNEYIDKYNVDLDDFYEGPLNTNYFEGSYYSLPYRSETVGLFYNKSIFDQVGLDPNSPPDTWGELLDYSLTLKDHGIFGFGQVGSEFGNFTTQLITLIQMNGGNVLNDDYTKSTILEPEAIEAAQFFVDMYREHQISPTSTMENDNTMNRNLFANEQVAMFLSGPFDIDALREANPDLDFGTALPPQIVERRPLLGGWNIGVTNTAKDAEAAFKFVNFIASPEISPIYSLTFSARKSAAGHEKYDDPSIQPFLDSLNYAQAAPPIPQWTQIRQILYSKLQFAMIGEKTVEQAMEEAAQEIDELLSGN